jgi:hypothetical protein
MLKHVRKQYERTNPTVVCGFGVTREAAEAALAQHPKGTFLLRFGSQGGILALSVRNAPACAAPVTHYSLSCAVLQQNGLEALLERNGAAEQLLDLATGQRHLRSTVLDRSYLQMVDVAEARKRYRWGWTARTAPFMLPPSARRRCASLAPSPPSAERRAALLSSPPTFWPPQAGRKTVATALTRASRRRPPPW